MQLTPGSRLVFNKLVLAEPLPPAAPPPPGPARELSPGSPGAAGWASAPTPGPGPMGSPRAGLGLLLTTRPHREGLAGRFPPSSIHQGRPCGKRQGPSPRGSGTWWGKFMEGPSEGRATWEAPAQAQAESRTGPWGAGTAGGQGWHSGCPHPKVTGRGFQILARSLASEPGEPCGAPRPSSLSSCFPGRKAARISSRLSRQGDRGWGRRQPNRPRTGKKRGPLTPSNQAGSEGAAPSGGLSGRGLQAGDPDLHPHCGLPRAPSLVP